MFRDLFDRMGYTDDNEFDWTGKTMVNHIFSSFDYFSFYALNQLKLANKYKRYSLKRKKNNWI